MYEKALRIMTEEKSHAAYVFEYIYIIYMYI